MENTLQVDRAETEALPFVIADNFMADKLVRQTDEFRGNVPFEHIVIDNFLPEAHAAFLAKEFPRPDHPVWLDWRKRSSFQWGKQGPGDCSKFSTLEPLFRLAMNEFNAAPFLKYLGRLTGIERLLPDPYFSGGGMHQIVSGGILDIHTDFNLYRRLGIYRRLNVLIYLTEEWREGYGGCLQLWDKAIKAGGRCVRSIPPLYNRAVIFKTDKKSFHGHPIEWAAPSGLTRRSIALYYYTADREEGGEYSEKTDFQNVVSKPLP